MKEELQQIQAVAVVTFLCVLIAIHSSGEYGEWFEISGTRQDIFDRKTTLANLPLSDVLFKGKLIEKIPHSQVFSIRISTQKS